MRRRHHDKHSAGPLEPIFDVGAAEVIFAVESDLISQVPGWLAYARQFAANRRPDETGGKMSRVYAIESTPTLIGAKADHRLPMSPPEILSARPFYRGRRRGRARRMERIGKSVFGLAGRRGTGPDAAPQARALVHAGREQPLEVQLLAEAINRGLGVVRNHDEADRAGCGLADRPGAIARELTADMAAGKVDTLVIIDTNPVYTAPADLDFSAALQRVPLSVSLALYRRRDRAGQHLAGPAGS